MVQKKNPGPKCFSDDLVEKTVVDSVRPFKADPSDLEVFPVWSILVFRQGAQKVRL